MAYLSDNSNSIPNAYYEELDDAISTAYQMGLTAGATNTNLGNVTVTYTVQHAHVDGCYSRGKPAYYISSHSTENDDGRTKYYGYATCSVCGKSWHCSLGYKDWGTLEGDALYDAKASGHISNGMCYNTAPTLSCGKTPGTYTTTDTATLGVGDTVTKAEITF